MSSLRNRKCTATKQSLAERFLSLVAEACATRGGGVLHSQYLITLLDNWNTGTKLPPQFEALNRVWRNCLAKRTSQSAPIYCGTWGGSFLSTILLDNWITGTLLSPHCLHEQAAKSICLAGQRFTKPFSSGHGVMTFPISGEQVQKPNSDELGNFFLKSFTGLEYWKTC